MIFLNKCLLLSLLKHWFCLFSFSYLNTLKSFFSLLCLCYSKSFELHAPTCLNFISWSGCAFLEHYFYRFSFQCCCSCVTIRWISGEICSFSSHICPWTETIKHPGIGSHSSVTCVWDACKRKVWFLTSTDTNKTDETLWLQVYFFYFDLKDLSGSVLWSLYFQVVWF